MKKSLLLLFLGTIFCACSDKNEHLVFVTDIVMPPESWVFTPGDGVTISAKGFETDDRIMFEIYWEEGAESFAPNGYAKGVWGVITSRTATSITFLAPGHYPASTTRVLLLRGGRVMSLGKIRVDDGVSKTVALYGISESDTDRTEIDRIDLVTGDRTRVQTLSVGQGLTCAVGASGSGWIHGIYSGSKVGVDITMRYWNDFGFGDYLFAGQVSDSALGFLDYDSGRLTLTTESVTRTDYSPVPISWRIPEEVARTLIVQPFVRAGSNLLLALRNADGTCAPVVLNISGGAWRGEVVEADAMIPFWSMVASVTEPETWSQVGGYAVSAADKTQLRLINLTPESFTFEETLAEVPGTVLSVAEYAPDKNTLEIYLLCEEGGPRRIHVYDALKKTQRTLPGVFDCSEIVLAK